MKIKKRDGSFENLSFDRITYRLRKLAKETILGVKLKKLDIDIVAQKVISGLYDGINSSEIDEEAARIALNMIENEEYPQLAARLVMSNLHKNTIECFSDVMEKLYGNVDSKNNPAPILNESFIQLVRKHKNVLNDYINFERDFRFDYFGFKTLERGYLFKINGKVVERPQHLYMRVALALHQDDIEDVCKTYDLLSTGMYTQASPTLFNAGKNLQNLSSCFLLNTSDSIVDIYKTITDCALISKIGGGIGFHISQVRAKGSRIRKTNGTSDGIVPMLKVFDSTSSYCNQSSSRKGSFAAYLEPWHADIFAFLDLRKNQGHEDLRARNLYYALWVPDLFMKAVEEDSDWWLMCPDNSPGLTDVYAEDFENLYNRYVKENRFLKVIKARTLWNKILEAQSEQGMPYLLYKDAVNRKSNQENIGVIKSSNLCSEICIVSNERETGVCNLQSFSLPSFVEKAEVKPHKLFFNHQKFFETVRYTIKTMNRVIDVTHYPTKEAEYSNKKNRPLGCGIQGLASLYMQMRVPFGSEEAKVLNREIFETLQFACLTGSVDEAKIHGPYESFEGSPASKGILQFDMWKKENPELELTFNERWDWDQLKKDIQKYGLRNSLQTAQMPTASTSQLLGNSESIDPIDACIFKRRVLSGEFMVVNKYLVKHLTELKLWNKTIIQKIILDNGSIQNVKEIPQAIKGIYLTAWEMSMKDVIIQSADRAVFIDQTQSLNLFIANPTIAKLSSMHFFGWKKGLKTGIYYLRSKPMTNSAKFSIDPTLELEQRKNDELQENTESEKLEQAILACSIQNKDGECTMCSS